MNYTQRETNIERVGFDYDGVLSSNQLIQLLASSIYTFKCIITKRSADINPEEVYSMAKLVGIPAGQVYFTDHEPKSQLINELKLTKFFDDDVINIQDIADNTNCEPVFVKSNLK